MSLTVQKSYSNISTDTTTTLKAESGHLFSVIINSSGSGTGTITIFDSASASGLLVAVITLGTSPVPLLYDCDLLQGLTIVTAGTGAAANITVVWN